MCPISVKKIHMTPKNYMIYPYLLKTTLHRKCNHNLEIKFIQPTKNENKKFLKNQIQLQINPC